MTKTIKSINRAKFTKLKVVGIALSLLLSLLAIPAFTACREVTNMRPPVNLSIAGYNLSWSCHYGSNSYSTVMIGDIEVTRTFEWNTLDLREVEGIPLNQELAIKVRANTTTQPGAIWRQSDFSEPLMVTFRQLEAPTNLRINANATAVIFDEMIIAGGSVNNRAYFFDGETQVASVGLTWSAFDNHQIWNIGQAGQFPQNLEDGDFSVRLTATGSMHSLDGPRVVYLPSPLSEPLSVEINSIPAPVLTYANGTLSWTTPQGALSFYTQWQGGLTTPEHSINRQVVSGNSIALSELTATADFGSTVGTQQFRVFAGVVAGTWISSIRGSVISNNNGTLSILRGSHSNWLQATF